MGLWGGRFTEPTDEDLRRLNDSFPYDRRMYAEDIAGSVVYAKALAKARVLTADESEQIIAGLQKVKAEFDTGTFESKGDEDIHTAVERRLTELIGAVGGKLHTGRSRNDQVATDFRLWVMAATDRVLSLLGETQVALVQQSGKHLDTLMPGYTHMQPAQPISAAHWLMSFFWMLGRDYDRLTFSRNTVSVMSLGAGALTGNPFDLDREWMASELGFEVPSQNSLDAVSDRDFAVEFLFNLSLMGVHLSRLAEDIVIYSNPSFGFVLLDDRYSTGSSIMPQKKNPDSMELVRGKAGRLIGQLTGLLVTLKGLPSTYNKDLQEDKEAVFASYDTIVSILPVVTAVINTLNLNAAKMKAALSDEMLATELADYLVRKGMPFREGHHVVGRLVKLAEEKQTTLTGLSLQDFQNVSPIFEQDIFEVMQFDKAVNQRNATGGTGRRAVEAQIAHAKRLIEAK